ncbi:hypothetical protein [Gulosibacter bifidus]|uniref:Uncharacterized protein n=1 Tax=Gulosibacter bifidus TaxID=272239 RepID=A0ABW5RJQ2_9MICO|nr:hypothetical protein [Gulosibacter bifidus]
MTPNASTTRWQQLLNEPDSLEAASIGIDIIADGGEAAYRKALSRWHELRETDRRDAHAGIAVILGDAFDDDRALARIATEWDEVFPEEIAWRCAVRKPSRQLKRVFGAKALAALNDWVESGSDAELPAKAARACRILAPNDHGTTYLMARRLLLERAQAAIVRDGKGDTDAAERVADDLLIAAAIATPNSPEVQQTLLSYWGEAQPLDTVPTAEPLPGAMPASWQASCAILERTDSQTVAERFADLIGDVEEVERGGSEAADYLAALSGSSFADADARLLEFAKSENPAAGVAVRELAARRRRLAESHPAYLDRVNALVDGLREHELLHEVPGRLAREALAKQRNADESLLSAAAAIADAFGTPQDAGSSWQSFADWLDTATIPDASPVPPAQAQKRRRRGFGLFG